MKYTCLVLFLVTLLSCSSTPPDLTTTLPFWLGIQRDSLHALVGEPSVTNENYDGNTTESFWEEGFTVEYVDDHVYGITASRFVKGTDFQGTLYGLRLSDGLSECEDRFGEYVSEKYAGVHTVYTWYYEGNTIHAEVLEESGTWSTGGEYEKGTLRTLEVKKGAPEIVSVQ